MLVSFQFAPSEAGLINILILACSLKIKRYNWSALWLQVVLIPAGAHFTLKAAWRHFLQCTLAYSSSRSFHETFRAEPNEVLSSAGVAMYRPHLVSSTRSSCRRPAPRRASTTGGRSHSDLELDLVLYSIQSAFTVFLLWQAQLWGERCNAAISRILLK